MIRFRTNSIVPLFILHLGVGAALWVVCDTPSLAQQSTTGTTHAGQVILETFQLKNIDGSTAEQVIQTLMAEQPNFRCAIDGNSRLIAAGTKQQLETLRETLAQLDRAPDNGDKIKLFSLRNTSVDSIAEVLSQLFPRLTLATERQSNTLVVTASESDLELVELIALRLDEGSIANTGRAQPTASHGIELFWLIEAEGDAELAANQKPDGRIANAVAELLHQGFRELVQVSQARVVVRTGGEFRVRSAAQDGSLAFSGELMQGPEGGVVLSLDLHIEKKDAEVASLMTEIATQPGRNVVIGVAGATPEQSDRRSAFVIRVDEP